MFDKIMNLLKKVFHLNNKNDNSKDAAKERLHLVLIQDRASVSADFLEVMKQEIIDVIKKYIEVDESAIDVRLTNNVNEDGKCSSPALYANFPITNVKNNILKDENSNEEEKENKTVKEAEKTVKSKEKSSNKKVEEKVEPNETVEVVEESKENAVSNVEENK